MSQIAAPPPPSYGAIPYNIDNTYYLGETTMTADQRRVKLINCLVPIVAAFLIVGGAAFFLLRDFSHLYPTSGGGGSETQQGFHSIPAVRTNVAPAKRAQPLPTSSTSHFPLASCDDNAKCAELGLAGLCCPTVAGVTLLCCDH
jgi:hypothetical protein